MTRKEKTTLLRSVLATDRHNLGNTIHHEVSIRKNPSVTPEAWSDSYHLDMTLMQKQRKSSDDPFRVRALEIKSCRSDFTKDSKWRNYLNRTDYLEFVCFPGVIEPEDLEGTPAGLRYITLRKFTRPAGKEVVFAASCETVRKAELMDVSFEARFDLMYGMARNESVHTKAVWREVFEELAPKTPSKFVTDA